MKYFLKHLLIASLLIGFASCGGDDDNDDIINNQPKPTLPDIAPLSINIMLVDRADNNLLSFDTTGNWMDTDISAIYNGLTYTLDWNTAQQQSLGRAAATFKGLHLKHMQVEHGGGSIALTNQFYLAFGEFSPYDDMTVNMTLKIAENNSQYQIRMNHTYSYNDVTASVDETTEIILNGEPIDYSSGYIKLVMPTRITE